MSDHVAVRRRSSAAEQLFRKQQAPGSNPGAGSLLQIQKPSTIGGLPVFSYSFDHGFAITALRTHSGQKHEDGVSR